jgi:hypothetical protein
VITAVKKQQQTSATIVNNQQDPSGSSKEERLYEQQLDRICGLAKLHGIREQKLAEWMGISLSGDNKASPNINVARRKPHSASTMPPLQK